MTNTELSEARMRQDEAQSLAAPEMADAKVMVEQILKEARDSMHAQQEYHDSTQEEKQRQITRLTERSARLQSCVDFLEEAAAKDAAALEESSRANSAASLP